MQKGRAKKIFGEFTGGLTSGAVKGVSSNQSLSCASGGCRSGRPPSKFRAQRTVVDGITFASKKEARRYGTLRLMQRAGEISGLELQPKFSIVVNDAHICNYIADFQYVRDGKTVVEDVKGFKTRDYRLKKKLMLAALGIAVQEV